MKLHIRAHACGLFGANSVFRHMVYTLPTVESTLVARPRVPCLRVTFHGLHWRVISEGCFCAAARHARAASLNVKTYGSPCLLSPRRNVSIHLGVHCICALASGKQSKHCTATTRPRPNIVVSTDHESSDWKSTRNIAHCVEAQKQLRVRARAHQMLMRPSACNELCTHNFFICDVYGADCYVCSHWNTDEI